MEKSEKEKERKNSINWKLYNFDENYWYKLIKFFWICLVIMDWSHQQCQMASDEKSGFCFCLSGEKKLRLDLFFFSFLLHKTSFKFPLLFFHLEREKRCLFRCLRSCIYYSQGYITIKFVMVLGQSKQRNKQTKKKMVERKTQFIFYVRRRPIYICIVDLKGNENTTHTKKNEWQCFMLIVIHSCSSLIDLCGVFCYAFVPWNKPTHL